MAAVLFAAALVCIGCPPHRTVGKSALGEVHFVNEVGRSGEFLEDPHDVTDIDGDGALQFIFERNVTAHRFPVAVEGEADQVAVRVEHGAARVASCDVGAVDEANLEFIGLPVYPAAEVAVANELLEFCWNHEFWIRVVHFFEDAIRRCEVVVSDGVGRFVRFNEPVGHPHGGVGVRGVDFVRVHGAQAGHEQAVPALVLVL